MTSELPYLKEIADSLKILSGRSGKGESDQLSAISRAIINASVTQNNTNNTNLGEVNETLQTGLVTTVIEGEGSSAQEVQKGILDVMKEAFVQVFREAMFTVVGEGSAAHEESVFKVMKDEVVATIHDSLNVTVTEGNDQVEKSLATLINEQNETLAAIQEAQEGIEDALSGSGGGGISGQLNSIVTTLGDVETAVGNVETATNQVNTTVSGMGTDISGINNKLGTQYDRSTALGKLEQIAESLETSVGSTPTLYDKVADIDNLVRGISGSVVGSPSVLGQLNVIASNTGRIP